jgi:HEAT repeats
VTDKQPSLKPRSRKMYILWAIALALLLALGASCWLVVVPVWRASSALNRISLTRVEMTAATLAPGGLYNVEMDKGPLTGPRAMSSDKAIELLFKTRGKAIVCLRAYLTMPRRFSPRRIEALYVLGHCRAPAVPLLERSLADKNAEVRCAAAWALGNIGPDARHAVPGLRGLLEDEDWYVREAAAEALKKIKAAESATK